MEGVPKALHRCRHVRMSWKLETTATAKRAKACIVQWFEWPHK